MQKIKYLNAKLYMKDQMSLRVHKVFIGQQCLKQVSECVKSGWSLHLRFVYLQGVNVQAGVSLCCWHLC